MHYNIRHLKTSANISLLSNWYLNTTSLPSREHDSAAPANGAQMTTDPCVKQNIHAVLHEPSHASLLCKCDFSTYATPEQTEGVGCVRAGSHRGTMNKRQIVSHAGFSRSFRRWSCFIYRCWTLTGAPLQLRGDQTWVSADCLFSFFWPVPLIADLHIKKTSLVTINTSAVALVTVFSCINSGMRYY